MRPFRNNQKRIRNRGPQDRPFKRSNDINRVNSDFGNRENPGPSSYLPQVISDNMITKLKAYFASFICLFFFQIYKNNSLTKLY